MEITSLAIPDVKLLTPPKFSDHRGFFSETYSKRRLAEAGIDLDFVQDNHVLSREKGVVRGLHFQVPPAAQAKLIWVVRGAVFDVAVDIRRSSPTFGRHVCEVLSGEDWKQLLVPAGFAHGYATLEPDTELVYKVTDYYSPRHERGIVWNDPALAIPWPVAPGEAILSERDQGHPPLSHAAELFD
jgi:dTDP-4-dehydrorhamnose 3,5-epimerase